MHEQGPGEGGVLEGEVGVVGGERVGKRGIAVGVDEVAVATVASVESGDPEPPCLRLGGYGHGHIGGVGGGAVADGINEGRRAGESRRRGVADLAGLDRGGAEVGRADALDRELCRGAVIGIVPEDVDKHGGFVGGGNRIVIRGGRAGLVGTLREETSRGDRLFGDSRPLPLKDQGMTGGGGMAVVDANRMESRLEWNDPGGFLRARRVAEIRIEQLRVVQPHERTGVGAEKEGVVTVGGHLQIPLEAQPNIVVAGADAQIHRNGFA